MSIRDLTRLHPRLQVKIAELRNLSLENGIRVGFACAVRDRDEQNRLFAQGRTAPGKIVTSTKYPNSQHNWGVAVDFFIFAKDANGRDIASYDVATMNRVGALAVTLGLGWGGHWGFVDRPHLYLKDWGSTTARLVQLYGTPDRFMAIWNSNEEVRDPIVNTPGNRPILRQGARGEHVQHAQSRLVMHGANIVVDGIFGPRTDAAVRDFQRRRGLVVDGSIGPMTWAELLKAPSSTPTQRPILRQGARNDAVRELQTLLNKHGASPRLTVDGIFGPITDRAVREFQRRHKIAIDGVVGQITWGRLLA